jgi:hypothetical protein
MEEQPNNKRGREDLLDVDGEIPTSKEARVEEMTMAQGMAGPETTAEGFVEGGDRRTPLLADSFIPQVPFTMGTQVMVPMNPAASVLPNAAAQITIPIIESGPSDPPPVPAPVPALAPMEPVATHKWGESGPHFKQGKFSKRETDLIVESIRAYSEANNITIEVC